MAEESYPRQGHNERQVTDIEHELLAARFSDDGVYGDPTDTAVATAGTGLSVDIRADVAASVRGHGWYSGTDAFSVGVSGNSASSPRIDWIVLRLDRSDWTVTAAVVGGTPGSGAPALTQETGDTGVYEIPLAQARVLGGASSVTVTRAEQYVGTRCRPCTSTTRNPAPRFGEECAETDTGRRMWWDGTAWRAVYHVTSTVNVDSPMSSWSMVASSAINRSGNVVTLRCGTFERRTNLSSGADSRLPILIPADERHAFLQHQYPVYLTGARIGNITVYPANHNRRGQVWLTQHPGLDTGQLVNSASTTWTV